MKNPLTEFAETCYKEGETTAVFAFTIDKENVANYCMQGFGPRQFAIMAREWLEDAPEKLHLSADEILYAAFLCAALENVETLFNQTVTSTFQ